VFDYKDIVALQTAEGQFSDHIWMYIE